MKIDKPITIKTLRKKLKYWQGVLDLSNWSINIRYGKESEVGEKDIGMVTCDYESRKASIIILDKYNECEKYETFYNIDTIVLHELIHILLWEKSDALPSEVTNRKSFSQLEEFVCDKMADIIYRCNKKKEVKIPKI